MNDKTNFVDNPKSYWLNMPPHTSYPTLSEDIDVDVAIVGGGITGITTAYFLNKQGLKVVILEADRILHGTTGHTTAKITSQHGLIYNKIKNKISEELARQYADANESAIRTIENIMKDHNIECDFYEQSAYVYTQQDNYIDRIQSEASFASSLGIKATFINKIPLPIDIKAAVRFEKQAQFHPLKFLYPLADEFTKYGGKIYEQSRVVNLEQHSTYTLMTSNMKKVNARQVIIASHYPFYNKHGLYFSRIYPERSYVVAITAKDNYPGGMYITAEEPGISFRSQISDQGELIFVGGEHHKTGQGEETTHHYDTLLNVAKETFTVQDVPYRWSTQDCMTIDNIPYVGHLTSNTPNLYIATGYGKWGMTNSVASAMILKDLIVNGKSEWQDVYTPSRHTISASTKNFVVENINVAKELIKGKFGPLPTNIDIEVGEGKITELNGHRAGIYKDETGDLHVVNTTCPHMGCEINWNAAEKTWDCPCHGSRFSYTGEVIEGPTVKPLDMNNDVSTIQKLFKDDF
ncbi:FAD-dependent oxidoreductase [Anaeromicropila herbilytica]|uniref:(2Fe-2S)-binding protein n=1 Tax=Anaeromicropila herbilytica TaxID=2785025 RepID=A0A7R7EK31_9FIRM|nr:FAD-dependent oxidoreductase [Anaeromicropila herbilytica]BCN30223.1 (2Fe-2S)-binding protein [Anaeromicropila herbilytica]